MPKYNDPYYRTPTPTFGKSPTYNFAQGTHEFEIFLACVQLLQHDFLRRVQLVQQHLRETPSPRKPGERVNKPETADCQLPDVRCQRFSWSQTEAMHVLTAKSPWRTRRPCSIAAARRDKATREAVGIKHWVLGPLAWQALTVCIRVTCRYDGSLVCVENSISYDCGCFCHHLGQCAQPLETVPISHSHEVLHIPSRKLR